MSLTCTVLLFTVIHCYKDWTHPPLSASDDAPSSTPSSPLDTSPAQASLRRRTNKRSHFSPRLTTTRPALPFLATETASSKREDGGVGHEEDETTTRQAEGQPERLLATRTTPSPPSSRSHALSTYSTSIEPVTPSSARQIKRRTASVASRRSSGSSSVASVGFQPLPAALAPVVQSATDDSSLPHASSVTSHSAATSQMGLGRPPSAPSSRITASPASPSPHTAVPSVSTTPTPSTPSRSFSLPFVRRKVSTPVGDKENDLPAMDRLKSFGARKK